MKISKFDVKDLTSLLIRIEHLQKNQNCMFSFKDKDILKKLIKSYVKTDHDILDLIEDLPELNTINNFKILVNF